MRRWRVGVATCVATTLVVAAPGAGAADDPPGTRPGGRVDRPVPPGEEARSLLPYVPTGHRYSCVSLDAAKDADLDEIIAAASSVIAAVSCGPDGPAHSIGYYQFGEATSMNSVYAKFALGLGEPTDSDCPGDAEWTFHEGTSGGRILCFIGTRGGRGDIPATAALVWTADGSNILGYASAQTGDSDAAGLREWWNESAGPKQSADDTGIATASNLTPIGTERAILRAIPAATRRSCRAADRSAPDAIGPSLFASRYFLDGVVVCTKPDRAVDQVSYAKLDPEVIEDFTTQLYGLSDTELPAVEGAGATTCPIESTYSIGDGKRKRKVGTYACCFLDNDDGTQRAVWRWTNTRQGILAIAVNSAGNADVLAAWWRSKRSGPTQP
jgi:hypothetical protein